eukprot:971209-Amphidinium_carterae.1
MGTLLALFQKPHHVDYYGRILYELVSTCRRVLECQVQVIPLWRSMWNLLKIPPSPLSLLRQFISDLGWRWDPSPFLVHSPGWRDAAWRSWHLIDCDVHALLHEVRESLRKLMLRQESARRSHLQGAERALTEITKSPWVKHKVSVKLHNAYMTLVTDGLWTEQRRFAAGFRPTPSCAFCSEAWGTVRHVLWECTQWSSL